MDRVQLLTLISAELLFLVTRSQDIILVCKSDRQRTPSERSRVNGGLGRSLVMEFVVFVPASAGLVFLLSPLWLAYLPSGLDPGGVNAMLGVVSYGFPFVGLKRLVVAMALRTLREFASIAAEPVKAEVAATRERAP